MALVNQNHESKGERRTNERLKDSIETRRIDDQTVDQYGENLVENLRNLQMRAKSGSYQAPPVKRAYVPKNEKEDRPIGIPTTGDKILQRAVSMILEPIYGQEFLPFSFGFRPGRSQHQALEYLREQCFAQKVKWILQVDFHSKMQ